MHYHISLFKELERRISECGGELIICSGYKTKKDKGRIGLSNTIVRKHIFTSFIEWKFGTFTFRWQPELIHLARKINPDILVVMDHVGTLTYWRLGLLRKKIGFKYITWQCGYEYHPIYLKSLIKNIFLKLFDHHLAYHSNAKNYLISHKVSVPSITVIHNTIDESSIKVISSDKARQLIADEYDLRIDRPIILYVGAILSEKRLDVLIDAFRMLERGSCSLVIIGDGPFLDGLKSISSDLVDVKFPGRVITNVGRFFDAADVFVLPGTGGLAINEAMIHGLPIISSYADGSADDLIMDGLNGYLLKKGDAHEIAKYLNILLLHPELRSQMGQVSKERIITKFAFHNFIDRVIEGFQMSLFSDASTF
jgi:glycosyltransferase involved in cell wall biosynthesis